MRFSFGLVLFTLPIYLPKHEFSNFIVGIIAAAYPVAETIFGPVIGLLADKFGRRNWIYVGLCMSSLVLFGFTLSTNVILLAIIHSLEGVAAAMIVVSALAMVTDTSTASNRGQQMGIYDFANLSGYMVGIFTAGILTRSYPVISAFYLGSILAAVGAAYAYLRVKETMRQEKITSMSPLKAVRLLIRDRRAIAMFPIWLSVTTFIGMILTFGPRYGPSPLITSLLFAGVVLILAFTQPFFGHLSDSYGRDRLMMLGMLSLIGFFITVIAMFRWHFPMSYLVPFFAVFGVGSFAFAPAALASIGDFAPKGGRGITMGIYSVMISLGTIIGPLLGGYLLDNYGVFSLFYAGLIILISALGIAIIIAGPSFVQLKPLKDAKYRSQSRRT